MVTVSAQDAAQRYSSSEDDDDDDDEGGDGDLAEAHGERAHLLGDELAPRFRSAHTSYELLHVPRRASTVSLTWMSTWHGGDAARRALARQDLYETEPRESDEVHIEDRLDGSETVEATTNSGTTQTPTPTPHPTPSPPTSAPVPSSARIAVVHTLIRAVFNSTTFAFVGCAFRLVLGLSALYVLIGPGAEETCDESTFLRAWLLGYALRCLALVPVNALRTPMESPEVTLARIRRNRRRNMPGWQYRRIWPHFHASPDDTTHVTAGGGEDEVQEDVEAGSSLTSRQDATSNGDLYEDGEMFASQRMLASLRERYVRHRALQIRAEQIAFRLDVYHTLWFVLGNVWVYGCVDCQRCAPWLFHACVGGLAIGFLGYMMPLFITALIVLCLPCATVVLRSAAEHTGVIRDVDDSPSTIIMHQRDAAGASELDVRELEEQKYRAAPQGGGKLGDVVLDAEDAVCAVCLEEFEENDAVKVLPCRHHFHTPCVDTWLRIRNVCPLCKQTVIGPHPGDDVGHNGVPELEEVASSAVTPTAEPRRERFPVPNWARDEL